MGNRILYIEDESLLGKIVQESLESRGFKIDWYLDGQAASVALDNANAYDLAILDVMLPGEDGFTIGKRLRQQFASLPIIFLTARTQSKDVVTGFQSGANDYLRKPFSMEELIVRIENQLRTSQKATEKGLSGPSDTIFKLGHFKFNYQRLELQHQKSPSMKTIQLSHREGELLRYFAERPDQIIDRSELLHTIWEDDSFFHSRTLDVYVRKLRDRKSVV